MDELNALPMDFVHRLSQLIPQEYLLPVSLGLSTKRATTLRANLLKTDGDTLYAELKNNCVALRAVPWLSYAFIVENTPLRVISELAVYREGKLYVQSLSSMIPPVVLDPKPGEKVLDIAAAPGSKTTQIAALMQNRGELVANDSSQTRSYKLQANCRLQGATIARTLKLDGRRLWMKYPEYFDKTLVDVPCSMEGRMNTTDPKSFEDWSLKKVRDLSSLQKWLLRSAISATKPGGTIVYSTCTLSPEENEQVIDWVLEKEHGAITVEEIDIPNLFMAPAIMHWDTKHMNAQVSKTKRIYPSDTMEGFYIAKLTKLRSTVPSVLTR